MNEDQIRRYHVEDPNDEPDRRLTAYPTINPFLPASLPQYVIEPVANSLYTALHYYYYSAYQHGIAAQRQHLQHQQQQHQHPLHPNPAQLQQQHHQQQLLQQQQQQQQHEQQLQQRLSQDSSNAHLNSQPPSAASTVPMASSSSSCSSASTSSGVSTASCSPPSHHHHHDYDDQLNPNPNLQALNSHHHPASRLHDNSNNTSSSITNNAGTNINNINHHHHLSHHHNNQHNSNNHLNNISDHDHNSQPDRSQSTTSSTEQEQPNRRHHEHIKKPLNPFMIFMQKQRPEIVRQGIIKESAAINQLLGQQWRKLSREEQEPYYKLAEQEKKAHAQKYPGWSARDNYANQKKRKKLKLKSISLNGLDQSNKKCRARFGLTNMASWCKPCKRKKKCLYSMPRHQQEQAYNF